MEERQPPTWEEIRELIDRVDQVCRESEYLRSQAERARRRPTVWPDRRQEPQKHGDTWSRERDDDSPSNIKDSDGTL